MVKRDKGRLEEVKKKSDEFMIAYKFLDKDSRKIISMLQKEKKRKITCEIGSSSNTPRLD